MIFRQLFESSSSTYTYLLGCEQTRQCILIDPVFDTAARDLQTVKDLGLELTCTLETHIHADHLTGALRLRQLANSMIAAPAMDELPCVDLGVKEGEAFTVGNIALHPLFTPGHTSTHHAYLFEQSGLKLLFSGDALLIEACGRTDFQSGNAEDLYDSIHGKFFNLPGETMVYPGHDYEGRCVTTIAQEKMRNPRLGNNKSKEEFVGIMEGLDLPYPRKIDFAVPGNQMCGACPDNVPEELRKPCGMHEQG